MLDDIDCTGSAFRRLSTEEQDRYAQTLSIRRRRYTEISRKTQGAFSWDVKEKIVIIGDRPGPSRPVDPGFHHTPFYSTKHCSGWLNALQVREGTPEEELVWINSTDHLGRELPMDTIIQLSPWAIVTLGAHAEKWFKSTTDSGCHQLVKNFPHPQFWKRFRNKERYPLFKHVNCLISK